ncbi:uncharacterized protein LOC107826330 [Nicotiana tabacum]|uniref:Uncharacterized protein LOC107826330 n=1 Tax=Nicotiana tabacum TaxID=4097 RepID=A0A1S4D673_TOBAC|nr:uncharacterized protein LOC104101875 [Nicotiana tomentosiformis]XP_016508779.1 PREDICTED: uncharacterized protein LOC107826330 [Nicotiana tabacum]
MEEYLQCMKTLRTQMNDVEDQAAKITAEEQMQITILQNLENEINSVKCQTSHLREEIARILEKRGQICSVILEKQRKIASLEADSSTLNQTLELLQQERNNLSAKLLEKSDYYAKTVKDVTAQLGEQQGWIRDCRQNSWDREHREVMDKVGEETGQFEENQDKMTEILKMNMEDARTKLNQLSELKSKLVMENNKVRRSLELVKSKMTNFKAPLTEMDSKSLKEEYQALLSDKDGEAEYLQSLQLQIAKLMRISHSIKCSCGEEFKIDMDLCA